MNLDVCIDCSVRAEGGTCCCTLPYMAPTPTPNTDNEFFPYKVSLSASTSVDVIIADEKTFFVDVWE